MTKATVLPMKRCKTCRGWRRGERRDSVCVMRLIEEQLPDGKVKTVRTLSKGPNTFGAPNYLKPMKPNGVCSWYVAKPLPYRTPAPEPVVGVGAFSPLDPDLEVNLVDIEV